MKRLRYLIIALISSVLSTGSIAQSIQLDSERALLDALIGRLEQAALLSKSFIGNGTAKPLAGMAANELRVRSRQAHQLRSQLKRWYGSEPTLSFTSSQQVITPTGYARAMQINHGQLAELIEFGQPLKLRRELRGFMTQLALDCLSELSVNSLSASRPGAASR